MKKSESLLNTPSSEAETKSRSEQPRRNGRLVLAAFWDNHTLVFDLPKDENVVFGRAETCEVRVDHPSVSRRHARFHGGWPVTVEDLESRNGTLVRGAPISARDLVLVRPGDVIECGDVLVLLWELSSDGPSAKLAATEAISAAFRAPIAELVVGAAGRWFQLHAGARINLGRRGPLRRILLSLAQHRLERPGAGIQVQTLIEAGWPGEKMLHDAGLARAYTTIQRLRALGLQEALLTTDEGYLLNPKLPVRIEDR